MPSLEIHHDGSRKVYQILEDELYVGSGERSEIAVRDDEVQGRHARVVTENGGVRIEGLETELEVNGELARDRVLEHGDLVRIGPAVLLFLEDGEPKPVVPRKLLERRAVRAPEPDPEPEPQLQPKPSTRPATVRVAAIPSIPQAEKKDPSSIVVAPIRGVPQRRDPEDRSRHPLRREGRARASSSTGGVPQWMIMSLALLAAIAIIVVLVRVLGATSGHDPASLLNLAEHRLKAGDIVMARSYVDQAEKSNPDALELRRVRELRAKIEDVVKTKASLLQVQRARAEYDGRIQRFRRTYLDGKEPRREAAREFVPLLQEWLDTHRSVCAGSRDGQGILESVERLLAEWRGVAKLNEPDNATDILFKAGRRTRRKARSNYREAVALADAWLARNANDARIQEVRDAREKWIREGADWFNRSCRTIDDFVRSGNKEEALKRIEFIVNEASLPDWDGKAREKLAEVQAAQ